ncbi:hypothetical protein K490DRAFT_45462, partial [Saccharata proteae CBS 121410]
LKIGRKEKPFNVHKGLLCHYSKYFNAAFNGGFKEANEDTISLREVTVKVFGIVFDWLYTQQILGLPCSTIREQCSTTNKRSECHANLEVIPILEVYVFGDCYDMPGLRAAATYLYHHIYLVHHPHSWPNFDAVVTAWKNLPESALIRRMILDLYSDRYDQSRLTSQGQKTLHLLPEDFVREMMGRLSHRPHVGHSSFIASFAADPKVYLEETGPQNP